MFLVLITLFERAGVYCTNGAPPGKTILLEAKHNIIHANGLAIRNLTSESYRPGNAVCKTFSLDGFAQFYTINFAFPLILDLQDLMQARREREHRIAQKG